jgi:general secretion pathway protein F
MPLFAYQGFNRQGGRVNGTIDAPGRRAALTRLREQGVHATTVAEATRSRPSWLAFGSKRVNATDLALLTRQLATLIAAGLPLDDALAATAEQQERPSLQQSLVRVRERALQGDALHTAMAAEVCFPELCVNMVAVGESSGQLDRVLEQLADYFERSAQVAAKIRAALTYPLLMAVVGSGVLFFLVTFVLPKVTRMLVELDRDLPWPTVLLIGFSDLLAAWWWLILLLVTGAVIALRRYVATPAGTLWRDDWLLRLPLIGRLYRQVAAARFARTLGTLLTSGVALPRALEIAGGLLGNRVLQGHVVTATAAVREGGSLAGALAVADCFPPLLVRLTAAGEQSGQLQAMLLRAATTSEQQSEMTISSLLTLLEPLMILVMGVSVGFIVLAILLPIFEATQGF